MNRQAFGDWRRRLCGASLFALLTAGTAIAGQAPGPLASPNTPISSADRVYTAEQFSNTVSVIDPAKNQMLGVIRLGDPQPGNLSPLYRGQLLVHGLGASPDGRLLAVVSIGSNSVSFIDTATNKVLHTTYVGRAPHEAQFTRDGAEAWLTVRGEAYISVIDTKTFTEKARIPTENGPGMPTFSPDGRYAYICSSFTPQLQIFDAATHAEIARQPQFSPFCPNIAATPDGQQVWYTLKDTGKTVVIRAKPPFDTLATIESGPITNHVNFVDTAAGAFAYVTVGGLDQVQVYRRSDFKKVATIPVGKVPHGIWPSGDGTRVYVGLENADRVIAIDTATNTVIASIPIGQGPQALFYVPGAAPAGGAGGLQSLDVAGRAAHLELRAPGHHEGEAPTSVTLFDQGLTQVLQAVVSGLQPKAGYQLALAEHADGSGALQPLASFTTNPAGAAVVLAAGPIRQVVEGDGPTPPRFLVIQAADDGKLVQVQAPAKP